MSVHSSLRVSKVGSRHRNVLKRYERIKRLKADEKLEDARSIYGLPKVKSQKIKVKKEKAAEGEGAEAKPEAAAGTPAPATAQPETSAKDKAASPKKK